MAVMSAEREADRIRKSVWGSIARDPDHLPVDPFRIATKLGLDVFTAYLAPDVAGAIRQEPGRDPVVIINDKDSDQRQRFTCAHELGHYIDRAGSGTPIDFVDLRSTLATTGTDSREIFANQFAANLLMPETLVRAHHRGDASVAELAFTFGVSIEAMRYRLQKLGLTVGCCATSSRRSRTR